MITDPPITGGCACGAIRYESHAKPMWMFFCHCRDCQQAGGGPYSAAVLFPQKSFKIVKGEPKYFAVPSLRGGTHTRGFCAECGSRLLGAVDPTRPFIGVLASSLDDPAIFQPECHMFAVDAQPWDRMDDGLPRFDDYPPLKS